MISLLPCTRTLQPSPTPPLLKLNHPFAPVCRPRPSPNSVATRAQQSWGGELQDWEIEPYSSDAEVEEDIEGYILDGDDAGGNGIDFAVQNILAGLLLGALGLSIGSLLAKLAIVTAALVSAAFRYVAIGFLVILILAFFS